MLFLISLRSSDSLQEKGKEGGKAKGEGKGKDKGKGEGKAKGDGKGKAEGKGKSKDSSTVPWVFLFRWSSFQFLHEKE